MSVLLKKNFRGSVAGVSGEIRRRLGCHEKDSFLYIVPTKRKLRELQREFLQVIPYRTAPLFQLYTLETLASRFHTALCVPKRVLTGPAQSVLVHQAVDAVANELQYFRFRGKQRRIPKGTFEKIINVINKLKEKGVYPAALHAELAGAADDEKPKLHDILAIYEEYENRLGKDFIDAAGIIKEVNENWEETILKEVLVTDFRNVEAVFVSGFDEFSDPEITMLHHVSELDGIGTVIEFDYDDSNDELFGHLKENYRKFLEIGFTIVDPVDSQELPLKRMITRNLFQSLSPRSKLDLRDRITLYAASDREDEIELIGKTIKQLAAENPDLDLSKICVASYQPQIYTSLFREVFDRYGIPANITDRFALDQSPLVISLLALLEIRSNNFRVRDVMRTLSSPYFLFDTGSGTIDPGNLHEVTARLKITGGYTTWTAGIERRLQRIAEELLTTLDETDEINLRREERRLRKALGDLKHLSGLLDCFRRELTPSEFRSTVLSLIRELRVSECLLSARSADVDDYQREKDARAYQKFLGFLDDVLSVLWLQGKGHDRESLRFYLNQLRTALTQVRYNVRQRYGYGVLVTSFEETRGLQFDVMIVAGLVDGESPPLFRPEIFLSSARRERQERYHLTEQRYLFYQAITNFSEHLYLTYPRKDGDLELVSSSFFDALQKIVDVHVRRHSGSEQFSGTMYSEDELLLQYGLSVVENPEHQRTLRRALSDDPLSNTLEHLDRTIAAEKSRTVTRLLPEYEGGILAGLRPEAQQTLDRLRSEVFSITGLESYGRCPFQYFLSRVLRLKVVSEIEQGFTPLERGGILHEILFEFYVQRRERNLQPLFAASEEEFEQAVEDLVSIARRKMEELDISDLYWEIDRESLVGTPQHPGVLKEFLDMERQRNLDVRPAYFEVAFGSAVGPRKQTDPSLSYSRPVTAGNVSIRGKVDRIDLGRAMFTIIDYKTGSQIPGRSEIDLGMSIQLPVYLFAVEKILSEILGTSRKGVAGIYYLLKSPVKEQLGIGSDEHRGEAFRANRSNQLLPDDRELKAVVDQAIGFVNQYVEDIARGQFPVEPKIQERVCAYCDFKTVCRVQTRRS